MHLASILPHLSQSSEGTDRLIMVDYAFLVTSVLLFAMQIEGKYLLAIRSRLDLHDFTSGHRHSESILEMESPQPVFLGGLFDVSARDDFVWCGIECPCCSKEQDGLIEG